MIPKKIHYCWFGENELPHSAKKCIESWKKYFPNYEIIEWNEKKFDINSNIYVKEAYEAKKYAFVSDYARLKIIYENGGIYFDTDVEVIKPLENSMLEEGFFAKETDLYISTGLGFACDKDNKIIKNMLDDYENIHFILNNNIYDMTSCPVRNTKSIKKFFIVSHEIFEIEGIKVYPKEYFSPLDYKTGILNITEKTYSIHYGEATWLDDIDRKLLKDKHKYIKKYGVNIGNCLYKIKKTTVYIIKKPKEITKIIFQHKKWIK